jgi:hypothetical protein
MEPKERRASSRTSELAPRNDATPWSNGLLLGSGIFSKNVLRTSSTHNSRSRRRIFLLQQLSHVVMLAYLRRLRHRRYLPNKTCCWNPSQPRRNRWKSKTISWAQFHTSKEQPTPGRMHVNNQKLIYSKNSSLFSPHSIRRWRRKRFTNWGESSDSLLEDQCCCWWWKTLEDFCTLNVYS